MSRATRARSSATARPSSEASIAAADPDDEHDVAEQAQEVALA